MTDEDKPLTLDDVAALRRIALLLSESGRARPIAWAPFEHALSQMESIAKRLETLVRSRDA